MSYNEELQSNNDALRDILDEVNALPNGTGGVQADYGQNDPAEPDYIKNRPFYDDEKWRIEHEVRQFLSFESGFDWIIGSDNIFDTVPVGTKCRIVVDGATYIGTMAAEPGATGTYSRYIGNGHLKNSDLPDTGDPFVFFPNGLDSAAMIPCETMPSAATISVLESGEIVRIDPKFLPDSMQPDYEQNDPAARDYIKNRPFYREQKWKCVQEPQAIEVLSDNAYITGEIGYLLNFDHFLHEECPDGTVFKLVVGGDEYVGTYKANGGYVGNGALYTPNQWYDYPDTGEDFLIAYYGADSIGIVTRKPLTACEVSVYMLESEELVIDPQYASLFSGESLPYVIDAEAYTYGDDALAAILAGRQIYVKVPSQSPSGLYANFMPVLQYQLPQSGNDYLTLFYLKDGIAQNIMAALQTGSFDAVYGQIVMLLSQSYDECPLKVSPIK